MKTLMIILAIFPSDRIDEMFISVLVCQVLFLVSYICFKNNSNSFLPWVMMLIVCLTYFFGGDYYGYLLDFENGLMIVGEKEPLYVYLAELSGWNYTLWRFYIWGSALLFLYYTLKRLNVDKNIFMFALAFFSCECFAYGRNSLAMAIYFFGVSFFAKPFEGRKIVSFCVAILIIYLSYFAHRSILPFIILSPLALLPLNKRRIIMGVMSLPFLFFAVNIIFGQFLTNEIQMDEQFSSFQASAERAAGMALGPEKNWKAKLVFNAHIYSIYVVAVYIGWILFFNPLRLLAKDFIFNYYTLVFIIVLFGTSMLYGLRFGETESLGNRYLNFAIIPEMIIVSSLYQEGLITRKTLYSLIALGFASVEGQYISYYLIHGIPL